MFLTMTVAGVSVVLLLQGSILIGSIGTFLVGGAGVGAGTLRRLWIDGEEK